MKPEQSQTPIARQARILTAVLLAGAAVLTAGTAPRAPQHNSPAAEPNPQIQFAGHGNAAEIPMELAAGAVFVPARVDENRPSSWLLDTASVRSAVDPKTAHEIGFEPSAAGRLQLPAVAIVHPQWTDRDLRELGAWYGQRTTGILGLDFLTRVVAELDYSRLSIELYEPASWHAPSGAMKIDVHWIDGRPTIAARMRLAGKEVDGNFLIDTAASDAVVVSSRFLAANGMFPFKGETMPWTAVNASGAQEVWQTRGTWLRMGSGEIQRPLISITQEEKAALAAGKNIRKEKKKKDSIDGWIGGAILKKFRVVLDFPQNRIYLTPNRDFVFPFEPDASGATVIAMGPDFREYEIRDVREGSPAAEAGLMPGDEILVVDGESAKDLNLDQIRELFTQVDKSPVILLVRRLGHEVKITVNLKTPI